VLYRIADKVKNFAVIYLVDLDEVKDFNSMYELYDPMTVMFFHKNKHMMCGECGRRCRALLIIDRFRDGQ